MPKLPCTYEKTKPSAQLNLLDRLAQAITPLVATRPVHVIALLGLCAAYIQGGLDKLLDFNAAVAETQSFGLPFAAAATAATIVTELAGSMPAPECVHDARSERVRCRGLSRLSRAPGSRMAAAPDTRASTGRIRSDLVPARRAQYRGFDRTAAVERSRNARYFGCSDRGRDAGPVHRPQSAFAGDLPDGQFQSRARQQRRIVLRICVPRHAIRYRLNLTLRFGRQAKHVANYGKVEVE